jgi:uncharacterized repeat protein (TIGR01451 family)
MKLHLLLLAFWGFPTLLLAQWKKTYTPFSAEINSVHFVQDGALAVKNSGVYYSSNLQTWKKTLNASVILNNGYNIHVNADGTVYAVNSACRIYRSTDFGKTWTFEVQHALGTYNYVDEIISTSDALIIKATRTVYRLSRTNLAAVPQVVHHVVGNGFFLDITPDNNDIWLNSRDSLYQSTNQGQNWSFIRTFSTPVRNTAVHNDTVLVGLQNGGMWRSVNSGLDWELLPDVSIQYNFSYSDGAWFSCGHNEPVTVSYDSGTTWQYLDSAFTYHTYYFGVVKKNNKILVASDEGVLVSVDNGVHWNFYNAGLDGALDNFYDERHLNTTGDALSLGASWSGQPDSGWTRALLPLQESFPRPYLIYHNGYYYACSRSRTYMFRRPVNGQDWEKIQPYIDVSSDLEFTMFDAGSEIVLLAKGQSVAEVHSSTDNGQNWTVKTLFDMKYAFVHNGKIYRLDADGFAVSNNLGFSWSYLGTVLEDLFPFGTTDIRHVSTNGVLYLYSPHALIYSADDGSSFSRLDNASTGVPKFYNEHRPSSVAVEGEHLVMLASNGVFYRNGANGKWLNIGSNSNSFMNLSTGAYTVQISNEVIYMAGAAAIVALRVQDVDVQKVSGLVYNDANNSGVLNIGEPPVVNALISVGANGFMTSQPDGYFDFYVRATPEDTIKIRKPAPWVVAHPPYYLVSTMTQGLQFGLHFPPNTTDMALDLTNETVFRPGFDETIAVSCRNIGTVSANATLRVVLPTQTVYQSALPLPDAQSGDTLLWYLSGVPALNGLVSVRIEVNVPATTPLGTLLNIPATLQTAATDADDSNNTYLLQQIVVDSYSPNDKQVHPWAGITPEQVTSREWLTYTVRFQNTGTSPAEFVRLMDTLDLKGLDLSTFEVLATSHPMALTLGDNGVATFFFDQINLPPSTWNEPESHCFVKYRVRPKASLVLGDTIKNTAYIYFDVSPPIITNTVKTQVKLVTSTHHLPDGLTLQAAPNPTDGPVVLRLPAGGRYWVKITAATGALVRELSGQGPQITVDLGAYPAGVYTLIVTDADSRSGRVLVVRK